MSKRFHKKKKSKSLGFEVREDRNDNEYGMLKGKTTEKGKTGITVFIRPNKFGGHNLGLSPWGSNTTINISIPEDCIEVSEDEVSITIPVIPMGDFDADEADEWIHAEVKDEDEEDEEEDDKEEEDEDEDRHKKTHHKRRH